MLRESKIDEYGKDVVAAINQLFDVCSRNQVSKTDVLLCHQNGFIGWDGNPCIGFGEEGTDYIQGFNYALAGCFGDTTTDDEYFSKLNPSHFSGVSPFEIGLQTEMTRYLKIWENNYFLRILIELSHLANGEHYDWNLSIKERIKYRREKSNVIEEDILKKFDAVPSFRQVLKTAYCRVMRNGIAHSQAVVVQAGIILKDPKDKDEAHPKGLTFEQWEKMYIYARSIMLYIRLGLKSLSDKYSEILIREKKGIPILVPDNAEGWRNILTYPYISKGLTDPIWRFTKPDWA